MRFQIRALDRAAEVTSLTLDAVSSEAATELVRRQGLAVLDVRAAREGGWKRWLPGFGGVGAAFPLGLFTQELLTLLESGLSVVEAMETLREKEARPDRQQLFGQLVEALYQGNSLSQALARFPAAFPALYVATVQASERTGNLGEALGRYIVYQGQLDAVRRRMVSASIYPTLLILVGGLVIAILLGYVVPRFAHIFEDIGRDLPYLSRLLLEWGKLVADHAVPILAGTAMLLGALVYGLVRTETREWAVNRLMRIPSIGSRMRIFQLARFYRTLGMLLRGGIPIMAALDMTAGLLQSGLRAELDKATRKIREGQTISAAMEEFGLTTPVSSRMLRVGERTGQMGEMMERIAHFYDDEIARWVDWFIRLFEPVLMIFIGVAIGGIVMLMYFPIFELAGSIQ
jgi:general secretion pathway protein F